MNPFKHTSYGSHQPVLVEALRRAPAGWPIAELGTGIYSTPLLHWLCIASGRRLVSFENRASFRDLFNVSGYIGDGHELVMVDDWTSAPLEQSWGVALVDHEPAERRTPDALRLLRWASYVVIHDTGWWDDKHYHFKRDLFPKARYRFDYRPGQLRVQTTVLSMTEDLADFMGSV